MADPKKVFDIAKPGKSAPSESGRPIITTHKMMSRDPMMSGNDNPSGLEPEEPQTAPVVPKTAKKIEPLTLEEPKTEDQPAESVVPEAGKVLSDNTPAKTEEDDKNVAEPAKQEEPAEFTENIEPKESTEEPEPAVQETTAPADNETNEEKERKSTNEKEAKEKAELQKIVAQNEAIEKLIEDKTYFVKTSPPQSQRSAVRVAAIIVLVLLAVFIAADLLVDAKIIKTSIPPVVDLIHN